LEAGQKWVLSTEDDFIATVAFFLMEGDRCAVFFRGDAVRVFDLALCLKGSRLRSDRHPNTACFKA
jgi:hypothetical protein